MAEIGKGVTAGKLAINVQKKFTRAQEKVMQKLGKADETRDTAFEETVVNFNKQMAEGTKLQRDLKAYVTSVKTMQDASRRLQDCLADMYEPEWFGKEEIDAMAEEMIEKEMDNNLEDTDILWTDYHAKITDSSLTCMDQYLAQFPDIKARIAKRDRKMVDFDSARHHFASIQKGKKKDEAKIAKPTALLEMAAPSWAQGLLSAHQVAQTNLSMNQAEEDLGRAQKVFEELNVELQDELPALWDSRVGFYVNTFQNMAGYQEKFHKEMGKLSQNLNDIMTKLDEQRLAKKGGKAEGKTGAPEKSEGANHSISTDSPPKGLGPPPSRPPPRVTPSPDQTQDDVYEEEASVPDADQTSAAPAPQQCKPSSGVNLLDWDLEVLQTVTSPAPQAPSWDSWEQEQSPAAPEPQRYDDQYPQEARGGWDEDDEDGGGASATQGYAQPGWDEEGTAGGQEGWGVDGTSTAQSDVQPSWDDDQGGQAREGGWEEDGVTQNTVTNGSDGELPPGFLYKVKAVHDYAATDGDELELKAGDMVLVLAIDNPDEQDDGWLLGLKESTWQQNRDLSAKGVFPENFTQKV